MRGALFENASTASKVGLQKAQKVAQNEYVVYISLTIGIYTSKSSTL